MKKLYVLMIGMFLSLQGYSNGSITTQTNNNYCLNASPASLGGSTIIGISESANGDFSTMGLCYLFITAPSGFEFDITSGSVNSTGGGDVTSASFLFQTKSVFGISYMVNGTANTNSVNVTGIRLVATALGSGTIQIGAGSTLPVSLGLSVGNTMATVATAITSQTPASDITICSADPNYTITGYSYGGGGGSESFSTSASCCISGSGPYMFDPTSEPVGLSTLTYKVTKAGCTFTATSDIVVNASPTVTMAVTETSGKNNNDGKICTGDPITFTASGANSYKFYKTPSTLLSSSSDTYTTTSLNNGDVIYVQGTDANTCVDNSSNQTVTVNTPPPAPTFNPANNTFASTDAAFQIDTLGASAGTSSGRAANSPSYFTGPGIIYNSSDGRYYFFPDVAANSNITPIVVTYHYVDPVTGCESTTPKTLVIGNSAIVTGNIIGIKPSYCTYDTPNTITIDFCESREVSINEYSGMQYSSDGGSTWVLMSEYIPETLTSTTCGSFAEDDSYLHTYLLDPSALGGAGVKLFRYYYYSYSFYYFGFGSFGTSGYYYSANQSTIIYAAPSISITNTFNPLANCSNLPVTQLTYSSNGASGTAVFSSPTPNFVQYASPNYFIHWDQGVGTTDDTIRRSVKLQFTDAISGCINNVTTPALVARQPANPTYHTETSYPYKTFPLTFCKTDYTYGEVNASAGYTVEWIPNNPNNTPVYYDAYYPEYYGYSIYYAGYLTSNQVYYTRQYLYPGCVSDPSTSSVYNFTVNAPVTINIGQYGIVCSNQTISLNKFHQTSGPAVGLSWSTYSYAPIPGSFDDATSSSPTYTLGASDITNGYVDFEVITADPDGDPNSGCSYAYADTIVFINKSPTVTVTSPSLAYCSNTLIGLTGNVDNSAAFPIRWYQGLLSDSIETGFAPTNTVTTIFTPSAAQKTGGTIAITALSSDPDGSGPCRAVSNSINITISPEAIVDAGLAAASCGSSTISLNGNCTVSGGTALGATWTGGAGGAGAFAASNYFNTNPTIVTYTPTALESLGGNITFTLTSDDPDGVGGPCTALSSQVVKTINKAPGVNAGPDAFWCSNTTPQVTATKLGSTRNITWTKNAGSGLIVSPTADSTNYIVGAGDYALGTPYPIIFTATTDDPDGAGPCIPVSDNVTITLNPHLTVTAGSDITVCANQTINLSGNVKIGGIDRNIGGVNKWETFNGLGTFSQSVPNFTGIYYGQGVATSSGHVVPGSGELATTTTIQVYLVSSDPDGTGPTGPCLADSQSINVTINPLPIPYFDPATIYEYCINGKAVSLNGNLGGTSSPSGPSATFTGLTSGGAYVALSGNQFNFNPNNTSIIDSAGGYYGVRYNYKDNLGCQNYADTIFAVFPNPVIKFTTSSRCQYDTITFTKVSSLKKNVFANSKEIAWNWIIDGAALTDSVVKYSFANYGIHSIELAITSNSLGIGHLNCTTTKDTTLIFGPYPNTDYSWSRPCSVDSVFFVNTTTIATGYSNTTYWNMNDGSNLNYKSGTKDTTLSPNYKFATPGIYKVQLIDTTKIYKCVKITTKEVYIVPTYTITPKDPYDSSFAISTLNWAPSGHLDSSYSWQHGVPTAAKHFIKPGGGNPAWSGNNVWITNLSGDYKVGELSYLNSPCFNFSTLDKPMLIMKEWANTTNLAGAVLEASVGNSNTWTTVGQIGVGVNWYNTTGVVGLIGASPSNPTAQGFSGEDTTFRISRIGLSQYANQSNLMRFRLTFGSSNVIDPLNQRDGIALDSIWIGNRSKVVLMEHFTNSLSTPCIAANDTVNSIQAQRPGDVISIHYHTSFPGVDLMNKRCDADVSSKELYYGLTSVPETHIDGTQVYNVYGNSPLAITTTAIDNKALEDAKFGLDISCAKTGYNLDIKTMVVAKVPVTGQSVVVNIAVLERQVSFANGGGNASNGYQWVMRKMLPDAAGTYISKNWAVGDTVIVPESWAFQQGDFYDTSKIEVVAFVQNYQTKEVYQAAKIGSNGSTTTVPIVTAITTVDVENDLMVYPVPSDDQINVLFSEDTKQDAEYSLFNDIGVIVASGKISKGVRMLTFNSSQYAAGVYYLSIVREGGGSVNKKVMVIH